MCRIQEEARLQSVPLLTAISCGGAKTASAAVYEGILTTAGPGIGIKTKKMAPAPGLEPGTKWLTATYSTIELCRSVSLCHII